MREYFIFAELIRQPSSINCKDMSIDIIRRRRSQIDNCTRKIARLAPPPGWNAGKYLLAPFRVRAQCGRGIGQHVTRCDGVHIDIVLCPLICERLCELSDTTFCRRVGSNVESTLK